MTPSEEDRAHLATLKVLYVEDEPFVREQTARFLERRVGTLLLAEDGQKGLATYVAERPHLVVTDVMMPQMDGLAMAAAIRALDPSVPIVVLTAFEKAEYMRRAIELRVDQYVLKPARAEDLDAALGLCAHALRADQVLASRQRLERELVEARHEEAMGLLAGGMAHDYNNLLQTIMSAVFLAGDACRTGGDARPYLEAAESTLAHARELSRRLDLLVRRREADLREGPVAPLVRGAVCAALEATGCTVEFDLPDDLPLVRRHEQHLEGVFASITRNAVEAMDGVGTLAVHGTVVAVTDGEGLPLTPGRYLRLTFVDSGLGIAPDFLPKVFEPYASTKNRSSQKGVGLSLAIAHSILQLHRGSLTVESEPGRGTRVHVHVPIPE